MIRSRFTALLTLSSALVAVTSPRQPAIASELKFRIQALNSVGPSPWATATPFPSVTR